MEIEWATAETFRRATVDQLRPILDVPHSVRGTSHDVWAGIVRNPDYLDWSWLPGGK